MLINIFKLAWQSSYSSFNRFHPVENFLLQNFSTDWHTVTISNTRHNRHLFLPTLQLADTFWWFSFGNNYIFAVLSQKIITFDIEIISMKCNGNHIRKITSGQRSKHFCFRRNSTENLISFHVMLRRGKNIFISKISSRNKI